MRNRIGISAFWLLLPLLVSACSHSLNTGGSSDPVSSGDRETSLDWDGAYQGILPCADCEGIETVITLRKDLVYRKDTRYIGKDPKVFTAEGTFSWYDNGTSIMLSGIKDGPACYLVGDSRLFQLDKEGNRITGELAGRYVLKKNTGLSIPNASMTETCWKLVEVMGKPVVTVKNLNKQPHIILKEADRRLQGNGGCNTIAGSYEVAPGNRIRFSRVASTRMSCPQSLMDQESAFFKALEMADHYTITGDVLSLNRGKMAPLARFEAVYLQ